jgi:tRNA(Ile)-lysidine synthase
MKKITLVRSSGNFKTGCYLAFSGGVDSVVLLDIFLKKKIKPVLVCVDHLTEESARELEFCEEVARQHGLKTHFCSVPEFDKSTSLEAFWSKHRNGLFQKLDMPVLTGHHLDDCVEWYIMTSCKGRSRIISYNNNNVYRPLLLTTKVDILEYAKHHKLHYLTDPTNLDPTFNLRNNVRLKVLPHLHEAFPGLRSVVSRLIRENLNEQQTKTNT